jgi:outer membrane autotransporter protein
MTTPATDAILAMSNAGLNVIHSELDGLRTYRASLDKTGPESNVWGHYLGSKSDIDTSNGAAYKLSQNGLRSVLTPGLTLRAAASSLAHSCPLAITK